MKQISYKTKLILGRIFFVVSIVFYSKAMFLCPDIWFVFFILLMVSIVGLVLLFTEQPKNAKI